METITSALMWVFHDTSWKETKLSNKDDHGRLQITSFGWMRVVISGGLLTPSSPNNLSRESDDSEFDSWGAYSFQSSSYQPLNVYQSNRQNST